jgi:hypothetical protein
VRLGRYTIAVTELVLIVPSILFMSALFMRNVQPLQYEPAHTAQQIVTWYAARPRTGLWLLLIGFPLTVLITGGATIWHRWRSDANLRQALRDASMAVRTHVPTLLIATATLAAGCVLAIVALHILSD